MPIDRAQLRAFVTVLREGSFDAAARQLHVTAPAISQRVRQLEERLGQVLIKRGTPCTATDAGAELARHAEQIDMLEAETLHALARRQGLSGLNDDDGGSVADGDAPPVRIPVVVNADSLDTWFMAVADAVATSGDGPSMVLHIQVDDQDHTTALLRDGSVIAAVTAEPQPVQGCDAVPLGIMRYVAVASPDFHRRWLDTLRAPAPDAEHWAVLSRAPFIQFNEKDALQARFLASWLPVDGTDTPPAIDNATATKGTGDHIDGKAGARGVKSAVPRGTAWASANAPCFRLPTTASFVDACQRGLGWGMVPWQMAAPMLASGALRQVTRAGRDDGIDVPLYWQRWSLRSPVLARLTNTVVRISAGALGPIDGNRLAATDLPHNRDIAGSAPPATR